MKRDYRNFGEEQLVECVINGDKEAFDEIYMRTKEEVYDFIIKIVGNQDAANEIVQKTYIAFYRKLKNLNKTIKINSVTGFICGMGKKEFLVYVRNQGIEMSIDDIESELSKQFIINSTEKLKKEELSLKVQEAVNRLPSKYKEPLILWIYEGFKDEETANILGIPINTVKTRKYKAKEKLREWLSPLLDLF